MIMDYLIIYRMPCIKRNIINIQIVATARDAIFFNTKN